MKQLFFLFALVYTLNVSANSARYRLIITDNPSTTITIAWDQVSGDNPVIYYGTKDHGTNTSLYSNHKKVDRVLVFKSMNNHFAKLSELKANTNYYFVIKDSEGKSDRLWFKTAPSDNRKMSFISGGDSRNNKVPRVHANKMVAKIKPTAVFFGGDMTAGDTDPEWVEWMNDWQHTTAPDGRMFPIIPARGNHERSNNSIYHLFNTPSKEIYYDITFGKNLYTLFTLNSEIAAGGNQIEWLRNSVKNNKSIWKSAQYHKPMRPHVGAKSEGDDEYNHWAKLFYNKGFKLIFESDSHTVKQTYPIKPCNEGPNCDEGFEKDELKGTVYVGEGCWGAPLRAANDVKSWTRDAGSFNQFKYIIVSEDQIKIQTIKVDNEDAVEENGNSENVETLPVGTDVWKSSNGKEVIIKNTKKY